MPLKAWKVSDETYTYDEILNLIQDKWGGVNGGANIYYPGNGLSIYVNGGDRNEEKHTLDKWRTKIWTGPTKRYKSITVDRLLNGEFPGKDDLSTASENYLARTKQLTSVKNGVDMPVVVDAENYIICGHPYGDGKFKRQIRWNATNRIRIDWTAIDISPEKAIKIINFINTL